MSNFRVSGSLQTTKGENGLRLGRGILSATLGLFTPLFIRRVLI